MDRNPTLRGVLFAGCVRTKVSAHADNIPVFVSRRSDIKAVKKCHLPKSILIRAKVCGWVLGGVAFPCQDSSAGVTNPSASSVCGSGRLPSGAKLVEDTSDGRSAGGYLASKTFVLKGPGGGARRLHLPLDPLPLVRTSSAKGSPAGANTISLQIALE